MGRKKGSGKQVKAIPTQFDLAERVEEIARELIPKYHPHLVNADIRYLYVNKDIKRKGKTVIGYMEKVSKKVSAISDGAEFVMVISYESFQNLTEKQRVAIVDHELTHAMVDDTDSGEKKLIIIPHDVEEFFCVIERNNLYMSDLKTLGRVITNKTSGKDTFDVSDDGETDEDLLD